MTPGDPHADPAVRDVDISKIRIGDRFRRQVGDLSNLADSIERIGLLQPVLIDGRHNLIAGMRRIRAFESLGRTSIPCIVYTEMPPIPDCEIDENVRRKKFGITEVVGIKNYLRQTRRPGSRKTEASGSGSKADGTAGSEKKIRGRTRDLVGEMTGYSPRQVDKIDAIVKGAEKDPKCADLIRDVDSGKKSVATAYAIATRKERAMPKAVMPDGIYDVILADVPIAYNSSTRSDHAPHHYPTVSAEELCGLRVPAADNAIIFFWMSPSIMYDTVTRRIPSGDAEVRRFLDSIHHDGGVPSNLQAPYAEVEVPVYKAILDAWGFTDVKGEFSWDKQKMGAGSYVRGQHENCLIAVKGRMPAPAKSFPSVISSPRREYSRKPDEMNDIIEEMYPGREKYLELYPRRRHSERWDVYGNDTSHFGGKDESAD